MIAEESFVNRYLEPADRLNEVLFGLIMVFTFSLTAGLTAEDNPEGPRELLITSGGQLSPPGCAHAKSPRATARGSRPKGGLSRSQTARRTS